MEDGIWRTVSGRRIFIKEGQSLSDAINKSGKFKKNIKNKIEEDDEADFRRWTEEDEKLKEEDNYIYERLKVEESSRKKSKRK